MIALATVVEHFNGKLQQRYGERLLPSQRKALGAMRRCRTQASRQMLASCTDCAHHTLIPHSCGHRLCPHCQHHESQRWLERQQQLRVPSEYFLLTFTVPQELRAQAFAHQRVFYHALMHCAWQTINTFSENDQELKGRAGAIAVLHTHSRRLAYHPHVHLVVPAAAINAQDQHWRSRRKGGYLFAQKALAKVFRGKLLAALRGCGLAVSDTPKQWIVDCKSVGSGDKAITYLGRYLYRGVVRERDILAMDETTVTYRYTANNGKVQRRTLKGEDFLWQLLKHALPKGFRRARNYGFLHPNSKRLIRVVQIILLRAGLVGPKPKRERPAIRCNVCGGAMQLVALGLHLKGTEPDTEPLGAQAAAAM